jgi:hypothetical protein
MTVPKLPSVRITRLGGGDPHPLRGFPGDRPVRLMNRVNPIIPDGGVGIVARCFAVCW